jgi:hypothetical protein
MELMLRAAFEQRSCELENAFAKSQNYAQGRFAGSLHRLVKSFCGLRGGLAASLIPIESHCASKCRIIRHYSSHAAF